MDILEILKSIQDSGLAVAIRDSLYLFPMVESIHVVGLALVFGTIVILDLRMLGVASRHRPFRKVASDILRWTWLAFAITAITGALMFITNATVYYSNPAFRAKMFILVLAGLNMAIFELTAGRSIQKWDAAPSAPASGKAAAVLSLMLWLSVIFLGRWIGFTVTKQAPPANEVPVELNLDDLFEGTPESTTPPPPNE